MYKVFSKRFLRYLKENVAVLLSFFVLIVITSILVVCIQSSSQTILQGHINNDEYERIEDGQFTEFIPLSQEVLDKLCIDFNVKIQPIFSFDQTAENNTTVRFFKNRTEIDKPVLYEGNLPSNDEEILIDQLFATKNDLKVGDKFTVSGRDFVISGLASLSDYNRLLNKTSDAGVDFVHFTWVIVTDHCFDEIALESSASVTYTYDYILGEDTDFNAFKGALTTIEFDYVEYAKNNKYFSDYLNDQISQYIEFGDLLNGVDMIVDGATQLSDGLGTIDSYSATIKGGIEEVKSALVQLENGGKQLIENNDQINDGISQIYSEYSKVYNKFKTVKDKAFDTSDDVIVIGEELEDLFAGQPFAEKINTLLGYIHNYRDIINNTDNTLVEYKEQLSEFKKGLKAYTAGTEELTAGIGLLREGIEAFSSEIDEYLNGITQLREGSDALKEGLVTLKTTVEAEIETTIKSVISNTISVLPAEDNARMGTDIYYAEIYYDFSFVIAALAIGLFALVFAIITKQQISKETKTIGALFALGVSKSLMMAFYLVPTFVVTLLGGIVGYIIGASSLFMEIPLSAFHFSQSLPYYDYIYPPISLVFSIVAPVVLTIIINYILLNKTFSRTAVSLMRGEEPRTVFSGLRLKKFDFVRRFRIRQLLNDTAISISVIICVVISIVFFLVGVDTYFMIENGKAQTEERLAYEYIYGMQYPMSNLETTGEKIYLESLQTEFNGMNIAVSLIGIEEGNRFVSAVPEKNAYTAVAGSGIATKLDLEVGDYLVLFDSGQEKNFAFRITDIVPSTADLQLYMDIASMRTLFNQTNKYYNAILSETELDIDKNLVYSVTTKTDVMNSYDSQAVSMLSFIYLAITCSVAIYLVVLYLIVGMLVDRNALGISLTRVLGYRGKEIRSLYIQGVTYIVVGSLVVSVPVGKLIADKLSKLIYSKMAIGMDFSLPWYFYLLIFAVSLGAFAIILKLVIYKIRQINNTDILRSRL